MPGIFIWWGYSPGDLGDESLPMGSRGEAAVGRMGTKFVPRAEAIGGHCLQILTAETIKIWKFNTIYLLILYQYVSRSGLSDPFEELSPPAHAWR